MYTTVVIPVHNEQACIKRCLDGLSLQTVMPNEVLIVDNNCTDETIAIARRYPFVRVIDEAKQGICAATQRGFDDAAKKADIVLRCDADSYPEQTWVEQAIAPFEDKGVVGVTGPGVFYGLQGLKKRLAELLYMRAYFVTVGLALGQMPIFGSNCAVRASAWQRVSGETHLERQDIHDDMDISYHLVKVGRIVYLPSLTMPISPRPMESPGALIKRFPMGMRSIILHWPEQAPWTRWQPRRPS